MKSAATILGVVCLGVFLWLIVPLYVLSRVNPPAATVSAGITEPQRPAVGSVLRLAAPEFVAFDRAAFDRLTLCESLDLDNDPTFVALIREHRIAFVMGGTRVSIADNGSVRVLDGPLAGRTVYVGLSKLAE